MMAGQRALISVVMPVRNEAAGIETTLEAIWGQSVAEALELIVVDDGSTDATPELLSKAAKQYRGLKVVRQDASGIVPALNTGLSHARGNYIARMDAADASPLDRLERQLDFLEQNRDVAAVSGHIVYYDSATGDERLLQMPLTHEEIFDRLRTPGNFFSFVHAAAMFSRSAFTSVGVSLRYRTPFRFAEDYDLWLRLSRKVRFANLDAVLYRAESPKKSLRISRPFLAFKGVAAAWLNDVFAARGIASPYDDNGSFVHASDICTALAPYPDLYVPVLTAFLQFGWRLAVQPELMASFCKMLQERCEVENITSAALSSLACSPAPGAPVASTPIPPFATYFEELSLCCANV